MNTHWKFELIFEPVEVKLEIFICHVFFAPACDLSYDTTSLKQIKIYISVGKEEQL